MPISFDNRLFTAVANSANGDVSAATTFHYRQAGNIVWGTYAGGAVGMGTLVASVSSDGTLDMRYQHVTTSGEIKTGKCLSRPETLTDGRLRLHEQWWWTEGGIGSGESVVEELLPRA